MQPDLAGFRDAHVRARAAFAEDVEFVLDAEVTFPPGTPIDPETGEPYDPLVTGSAVVPRVTASANIARSMGRKDVDDWQPLGSLELGDMLLIMDVATASAASAAVSFSARGESYRVRATRFDGIGGIDRFLVFGERE